jgi:hypothetical protein
VLDISAPRKDVNGSLSLLVFGQRTLIEALGMINSRICSAFGARVFKSRANIGSEIAYVKEGQICKQAFVQIRERRMVIRRKLQECQPCFNTREVRVRDLNGKMFFSTN